MQFIKIISELIDEQLQVKPEPIKKVQSNNNKANYGDVIKGLHIQEIQRLKKQGTEIHKSGLQKNKVVRPTLQLECQTTQATSRSQLTQSPSSIHEEFPPEMRKELWPLLIPNKLEIHQKLYEELLDATDELMELVEKSNKKQKRKRLMKSETTDQTQADSSFRSSFLSTRSFQFSGANFKKQQHMIEQDLNRTHAELNLFQKGDADFQALKNLLLAYIVFKPDSGYVQGMNYLATTIYYSVGKDEMKTFTLLVNMLSREDSILDDFYNFEMDKINQTFEIFTKSLQEYLPDFHEKLEDNNVTCIIFLFEWIVTMYSKTFSPDLASRLWDSILVQGEFFIIKIALGICQCIQTKVLELDSFEDIVLLLQSAADHINDEELMSSIHSIEFTKQEYYEMKQVQKQISIISPQEELFENDDLSSIQFSQ